MTAFFDRLRAAARARNSLLCVGLDPTCPTIEASVNRSIEVIEATSDAACCYKPNAAFWERFGADGWRGLRDVRAAVPSDIPVLFDAKRADVGPTMHAYAEGLFERLGMDAVTVHAYHGADSLAEFTRYGDRGVYVVCHTSNPGRTDLQHLEIESEPLYVHVARLADRMNESGNVGLVVGATAPDEARKLRKAFPRLPFLMPGIGRQGGDVAQALGAAFTGDEASALIGVSSAIFDAPDPGEAAGEWCERIRSAASA